MSDGSSFKRPPPSHGLPLWTFLFTEPDLPLQSARVAAADRIKAHIMLAGFLGDKTPSRGVLCHCTGRLDVTLPCVASVITRPGEFIDLMP